MASRVWWKTGWARRSCLLIRKEASACHRSWWEETTSLASIKCEGTKGGVSLEVNQGPGSGNGGLIEDLLALMDGDETRVLRALLACDGWPGLGWPEL